MAKLLLRRRKMRWKAVLGLSVRAIWMKTEEVIE
jgi:hypothetical protein